MTDRTTLDFPGVSFVGGPYVVHRDTVYEAELLRELNARTGFTGDMFRELRRTDIAISALAGKAADNQCDQRYHVLDNTCAIGSDDVYWLDRDFRDGPGHAASDDAFVTENMQMGADPASFEMLSLGYARDRHSLYYGQDRIPDSDPASFVILAEDGPAVYARDAVQIYLSGNRLTSDTTHFEVLPMGFSRDATTVFLQNQPLTGIDAQSFEVMAILEHADFAYARDRNGVYGYIFDHCHFTDHERHREYRIEAADPATFQVLSRDYATDRRHVYHLGMRLNADVRQFRLLSRGFARDADTVFSGITH